MVERITSLFSSLTGRIFAAFWLSLCMVTLIVSHLPNLNPRTLHNASAKNTQWVTQQSQDWIKKWQPQLPMRQLMRLSRHHGDRHFYFTTTDGEPLFPYQRQTALNNFMALSNNPMQPMQRVYGRRLISGPYLLILPAPTPAIWIYMSQNWQPQSAWVRIFHRPMTLLLLTIIVSIPFLLWLAWAITTPARRLQCAAERVANGQRQIDPSLEKGPTELKAAGKQFNRMVQVVDDTLTSQQRLLSDISHELRSPLTRLKMAAALAARKQGDSPELMRIQTESERLEHMISQLLTLSRQQNTDPDRRIVTLQDLWQDLLEDAQFEAEQRGKRFEFDALPNVMLNGDINALNSALENPIRNAIKYAKHRIDAHFQMDHNTLIITLNDDGMGIPEADREKVFRPFYRVSEARDRQSGGTGLGLAIARQIVEQHQGQIRISESPQGGAQIQITLPILRLS